MKESVGTGGKKNNEGRREESKDTVGWTEGIKTGRKDGIKFG